MGVCGGGVWTDVVWRHAGACLCMYVGVCVGLCVCGWGCVAVDVCAHVCIYVGGCGCVCTRVYMCGWVWMCVHACVYVWMAVDVCARASNVLPLHVSMTEVHLCLHSLRSRGCLLHSGETFV